MSEIEYVTMPAPGAYQLARFLTDDLRIGQQHTRIQIALKRYIIADSPSSFLQINSPIDAQHVGS
jgi:hypothetical protein